MRLFLTLALMFIPAQVKAQTGHSVVATWTASSDAGSAYNIYRASGACPASGTAGFSKVGSTAVGVLTFNDTTVTAGSFCYYVTATLAGAESKPSNLAPASVLPGSVVVTVTVAQ